jgi:hypothetical protein
VIVLKIEVNLITNLKSSAQTQVPALYFYDFKNPTQTILTERRLLTADNIINKARLY